MIESLTVIGGGLAGSEAAWQAAEAGVQVKLYEMRPKQSTGAHLGGNLAELVCSNSLGSNLIHRASGLLKAELRSLGSLVLSCAEATAVPAGSALAVDRAAFSALVTERVEGHPRIQVVREELGEIPDGTVVIASGPLTSARLAETLAKHLGQEHLYFYDAIAPIVEADTLDMEKIFRGSRYIRDDPAVGDYLNCPLTQAEYEPFVEALLSAERIALQEFEVAVEEGVRAGAQQFFEGCLPLEIQARRDVKALIFGPLRPVGLFDPRTAQRPYAVVQLRQDNLTGTLYNLVGFQTNLTFAEQKRVFRMIPGLEGAEFVRYGQMHRNTFINSPQHLQETLQQRGEERIYFAGQICGVEGYMGNIATGLLAGINAGRGMKGEAPLSLPRTTMLGALCYYISHSETEQFQPVKANFGLLPELKERPEQKQRREGRRERGVLHSRRALLDLADYMAKTKGEG